MWFACNIVGFVCALISIFTPKPSHEYRLIWEDNFDAQTLDKKSWNKAQRTVSPWARHMSDADQLYEIGDGRIRLWCRQNAGIDRNDTATVLTAGITTRNKRTFKYGKIEVRARMSSAQGCWCAIWMGPDAYNMPFAEIDIMEHVNHERKVYHTTHTEFTKNSNSNNNQISTPVNVGRYNIYSVEILPEAVIYYVNGKEVLRYKNNKYRKDGKPVSDDVQYPFGTESYLLLTMHYGGQWVKSCNIGELPAYMDIDWVKAYELKR